MLKFANGLLKFARPHTITHTAIVPCVMATIVAHQAAISIFDLEYLSQVCMITLAFLCSNFFIVGINQVYDIEIDRINKPDLVLASGELGLESSYWILASALMLGFAVILSTAQSFAVFALWLYVLIVGTIYSIPPIRLKKNSILAVIFAITTCRGIVGPFCIALQLTQAVGIDVMFPGLAFILLFSGLWALVISIFKDIPDTIGDEKLGIETLSIKYGIKNIFSLCCGLMFTALGLSSIVLVGSGISYQKIYMHLLYRACQILWLTFQISQVDVSNKIGTLNSFYTRNVWGMLYCEWLLFATWF